MFTRRSFAVALAAFGAALKSSSAMPVSNRRLGDAASQLRALVLSPASAREIGRLYHAKYPEEDSAALARHILSSLSLNEANLTAGERQVLPEKLKSCVRADFAKGCTVEVGGWILSRTEARLCALCI